MIPLGHDPSMNEAPWRDQWGTIGEKLTYDYLKIPKKSKMYKHQNYGFLVLKNKGEMSLHIDFIFIEH